MTAAILGAACRADGGTNGSTFSVVFHAGAEVEFVTCSENLRVCKAATPQTKQPSPKRRRAEGPFRFDDAKQELVSR